VSCSMLSSGRTSSTRTRVLRASSVSSESRTVRARRRWARGGTGAAATGRRRDWGRRRQRAWRPRRQGPRPRNRRRGRRPCGRPRRCRPRADRAATGPSPASLEHVGLRGSGSEADLDHPGHAGAVAGEEDVLGLDPANGRGELVGEALDEERAAEARRGPWRRRPSGPAGPPAPRSPYSRPSRRGRPGEGEGPRDEVGDVAPHQRSTSRAAGTKARGAPGRQGRRRAGPRSGRARRCRALRGTRASRPGLAGGEGRAQGLERGHVAHDGVLPAADVEVDHLAEQARLAGDAGDEGRQLGLVHAHDVRAHDGHAVGRAALGVAWHEGLHREAALVDALDHRAERRARR
jgi:hypothetical protein